MQTSDTTTEGPRPRITTPPGPLRALPSAVACVVGCGLVVAMALDGGGYFPDEHLLAGAIGFATLAALILLRPPEFRISTPTLVAVASLSGLALWTALSSHWSSAPDVALEDFQRTLVYLALFGLGLLAAGSGRYSRHLVWAVLTVIVVVTTVGLLSRLRPDWISAEESQSIFSGYRLGHPVGYWNAFGALGAMGVVLGAGLAGDPRSGVVLRSLAAVACVSAGTAAYLSLSRGAWLAFFVGLAALAAMSAHRVSLLASVGLCGVALLATIGRLSAYPGLLDAPDAGAGQLAEGRGYLGFLVLVLLLVAVGQAVISGRWLPEGVRDRAALLARPLGLGLTVLALIGGLGVYVLRSGDIEGGTAARVERVESFLDKQWDEFMTPAAVGLSGTERLTTARGTRSDLYRVAIDGFQARPLIGDGGGGFEYRFAHDRDVGEKVRDAHSLYLETLGELGLPGVLLLLGFLGAVGFAAVTARRRRGALSGAQTAAAAAAFAVWAAHAGIDWDWQVPGLTGIAFLLAGAFFPAGRGRRRRTRRDEDPVAAGYRFRRR